MSHGNKVFKTSSLLEYSDMLYQKQQKIFKGIKQVFGWQLPNLKENIQRWRLQLFRWLDEENPEEAAAASKHQSRQVAQSFSETCF